MTTPAVSRSLSSRSATPAGSRAWPAPSSPPLERACRAAGFTPRIVHRADDARLVQALVASGIGIGMLPALACSPAADVRFAEVAPAPPRRRVWALVRGGAARRPALAAVLDALLGRAPAPTPAN
jgi:DNA-binding transcriptional LysR family regulator